MRRSLLLLSSLFAVVGCQCVEPGTCLSHDDCEDGTLCFDDRCEVPGADAGTGGGRADAGTGGGGGGSGGAGGGDVGGGAGGGQVDACGNGLLDLGESCDDRNAVGGDGCSSTCLLAPGWLCTPVGVACTAAACGDGHLAGLEECDDGNTTDGDGCSAACTIEQGWACDGGACTATVCGNGVREGIEQCDDGNNDLGDGCDTLCRREPSCTDGVCVAVCGDGVKADSEPCDDGNQRDGDGCSSSCQREPGFECTEQTPAPPQSIDIPVVYRDFIGSDFVGDGGAFGHPDFNDKNGSEQGLVAAQLGADGKPVYAGGVGAGAGTTHGQQHFDRWYRDSPTINRTVNDTLSVTRQGNGAYVFDSNTFFPLDGRGWQDPVDPVEPWRRASNNGNICPQPDSFNDCHNFNFTSELRYWFTFSGGEFLEFRGDDDVFVFINRRLAVDLGGVHSPETGSVTLDETRAQQLDLRDGGVYEAVVFQAERRVTGSNYKLTLHGFNAPRSFCQSVCGDGIVTRDEACDDGVAGNTGVYGACGPDCRSRGGFCGDGVVQAPYEQCDHAAPDAGPCGPTCRVSGCGDGFVDAEAGEQCDDGNTMSNDGCSATCEIEIG